MMKRIVAKLRANSGETIAETLVSLLIAALAITMLAGAISAASNMITRSELKLTKYYEHDAALANHTGADGVTPQNMGFSFNHSNEKTDIVLSNNGGTNFQLFPNVDFANTPVIAYAFNE